MLKSHRAQPSSPARSARRGTGREKSWKDSKETRAILSGVREVARPKIVDPQLRHANVVPRGCVPFRRCRGIANLKFAVNYQRRDTHQLAAVYAAKHRG